MAGVDWQASRRAHVPGAQLPATRKNRNTEKYRANVAISKTVGEMMSCY